MHHFIRPRSERFSCRVLFQLTLLHLLLLPSSVFAYSLEGKLVPDRKNVDNGAIINQLAKEHETIDIPEGTYYFSSPLIFDHSRTVTINGNLVYIGKRGVSAVTVNGNNIVFNLLGSLSYGNTPQFTDETENNTTIGINFVNVCNSMVYVNEIKNFNENIRVSGIGAGCSYNKFSFGIVRNCLVGLRIYQEDKDGHRGWANENSFYGGRFTNFSDWKYKPQSLAIKIAGPSGKKDSYNSNNSNLFLKQSFENFETVAYAKNTRFCDFLYARLEGSKTFVKFVGECRNCRISADYNDNCKLYDDSESLRIPIRVNECTYNQFAAFDFSSPAIVTNKAGDYRSYIEGCGFIDNSKGDGQLLPYGKVEKLSPLVFENKPAVNIKSSGGKIFKISSLSPCTIQLFYLTETGSKQIDKRTNYPAPLSLINSKVSKVSVSGRTAYTLSSEGGLIYFKVPKNIESIQIVFTQSSQRVVLSCTGDMPELEYPQVPVAGNSSSRPEYASWGQYYYDYTEKRLLFWNGSAWIGTRQ